MDTNGASFFNSEEAFLLKCLHEVVLVWKRGTGQANFSFIVKDGKPDLQLGFQLGQPGEPHLHPPTQIKRRIKSVKQRQRDRDRAASHQARQISSAEKSSTDDPPTPTVLEAVSAGNSVAASSAATPSTTNAAPASVSSTEHPPLFLQPAVPADHLPLPPQEPAVPVDPLPLQPAVPADHPPQSKSVRLQETAVF